LELGLDLGLGLEKKKGAEPTNQRTKASTAAKSKRVEWRSNKKEGAKKTVDGWGTVINLWDPLPSGFILHRSDEVKTPANRTLFFILFSIYLTMVDDGFMYVPSMS
jgi:hypothetical protein